MNASLSSELFWLVLTLIMTAIFWIPYIVNRLLETGIFKALWDPYGQTDTHKDWALRMMRAHQNAMENLVLFAPLVILIQITGMNTETTATACMTYFFARILHYFAFTFAIPLLRVITFALGFVVPMVLGISLLGI